MDIAKAVNSEQLVVNSEGAASEDSNGVGISPGVSPAEQLVLLNKAILAIQNGAQRYRIGNRELTRPNLVALYDERDRLEAEIAAENNGGIFTVAVFSGR